MDQRQVAFKQALVKDILESLVNGDSRAKTNAKAVLVDPAKAKQVLEAFMSVSDAYEELAKEAVARYMQENTAANDALVQKRIADLNRQPKPNVAIQFSQNGTARCVVESDFHEDEMFAGNPYTDGRWKYLATPNHRLYLRLDEIEGIAEAIKKASNLPVFMEGITEPID